MYLLPITYSEPLNKGQTCIKRSLWDKEKWPCKSGDLLTEAQFKWNPQRQDKKKVIFQYRWLVNRGDRMGRIDCMCSITTIRHKLHNVINFMKRKHIMTRHSKYQPKNSLTYNMNLFVRISCLLIFPKAIWSFFIIKKITL